MGLTGSDIQEVEMIAQAEIRSYFDTYLEKVLPKQLEAFALKHQRYCEEYTLPGKFTIHQATCGIGVKLNKMLVVAVVILVIKSPDLGAFVMKLVTGVTP